MHFSSTDMLIVRALARMYGFVYAVLWQAMVFTRSKPLTPRSGVASLSACTDRSSGWLCASQARHATVGP